MSTEPIPDKYSVGIDVGVTKTGKPPFSNPSPPSPHLFICLVGMIFAIVITYAGPNIPIRVWTPGNDDDWCIPSVMAYDTNGGFVWGHQAVDCDDALAWTKLLVDGSPALHIRGSKLEGIVTGRIGTTGERSVETVIGDFLGALRLQILATLRTHTVNPQVTWCLAMPGCWPLVGSQVFRDAVTHARLELPGHQVLYTSESWAAARWVEFSLRASQGIQDLDIIEVDGLPPHNMKAPHVPRSIRCGGVDVDSGLVQQLRNRFHSTQFTGEEGSHVEVQILRGHALVPHRFDFADLVAAFRLLVTKVYDLISQMIAGYRGKVTKVVVVAGMSKSQYFRVYMRNCLDDLPADSRPGLLGPITQAISAVARRAVLQAIDQPRRVESLKGYELWLPFIEPGHNGFTNGCHTFVTIRQGCRNVPRQGEFPAVVRFRPNEMGRNINLFSLGPPDGSPRHRPRELHPSYRTHPNAAQLGDALAGAGGLP
ncbi:hypothetical protein BDQ94DRAFT_166019 [Aspergillus welwitschiae]|uniref:Uncharacterized protein n=1 Tax=Aspergillus welwitschiae TaxID=1341132 RepID=A0A3F3QER9_9EURO|nr:hypothetical protein BDQ94DRAFT_166019 [Aspergillus welwitschiae]RDH37758.1 hypothetical protein BDQ94DRAFT_166019 [Aspergillus welwitschiae]